MNNVPSYSTDSYSTDLIDWGFPLLDSIELSPDQTNRAAQLSQTVSSLTQQWQTYLNALALFGFQEWLDERAPDLPVIDSYCSLLQPAYANLIGAVCNLQVGPFTLCLIATGTLIDAIAPLPRAAIDLPPFVPHIYVLVRVLEEQMQVQVHGYLRHDQLVEHQQSNPLQARSNWTYTLPLEWFNPDPTELLLDLRCLQPDAIPRSTPALPSLPSISQVQARLTNLLPQMQAPAQPLSQLLTWEDGATILSDPELANWVYEREERREERGERSDGQEVEETLPSTLYPLPSTLYPLPSTLYPLPSTLYPLPSTPHPAINVRHWLRDRLDAIAQELSWVLLPAFAADSGLRSLLRSLEEELENRGVRVPAAARGAYQDLYLENTVLRLYAITWILPLTPDTQGWTLLVVLGAQSGDRLPIGTQLRVQDETQILSQQMLKEDSPEAYLYAQVGGNWNEQFWITINATTGTTVTLPPFIFTNDE